MHVIFWERNATKKIKVPVAFSQYIGKLALSITSENSTSKYVYSGKCIVTN